MTARDRLSPLQFPSQPDVSVLRGDEDPNATTPVVDGDFYPYSIGNPANSINTTGVMVVG